jgi:putative spermidine/putrescine transport system substrate-binding protein
MGMASALGLGALFAACGGDDGGGTAAPPAEAPPAEAPPAEAPPAEAPPAEEAPAFTGTIRVLGLGVDLADNLPIRDMAQTDLGFQLEFQVTDTVTMEQKAITQPDSFDVFSGYHYQQDRVFPPGSLQPIEIAKITNWSQVTNVFRQGKVDPASATCTYGDGDAPFRKLYLDPDGTGAWAVSPETPQEGDLVPVQWTDESTGQPNGDEPLFCTGVPGNYNMDAMGYNTDVIAKEPNEVSWAELFNQSYNGRVALLGDPGIAMQDAANAAVALGLMEFGSLGNMTKEEIDGIMTILGDLKSNGQFRAFWVDFNESVSLMASGEVVLESMWSPAVALLVAQGIPVKYAAPPEGFRGWSGGLFISSSVTDPSQLQACYDYINWWHSGPPAAIMMRQGYYNAVQETSREFVEPEEWDFWIDGKAAAKDLPGITGQVGDIKAGSVRDGGSYVDRACHYSSWNSHFAENEHQIQRWNEFLAA